MTMHKRLRAPRMLFFTWLALVAMLLTTAGGAIAAPLAPTPAEQQQPAAQPVRPATAASPSLDKTTNILLLGSDRRPNTPNWRTDVMMIIAIDEATKQVGVISLPREYLCGRNPQPPRQQDQCD